ncbi:hypothetical protein [Actinokineospora sp.]|uniref:hypothetical protein n=1 Tax=Actinokineospora sp. TaxID=1872133 RepID=UPI004037B6C2
MTFTVQPAALRELAGLLDRAREDVDKSKTYFAKMENFAGGEGLVNLLVGGHRESYQALSDWLGKLSNPTLTGVSQAVTDSANYYQNTDNASAEKLDGTYPETNVTEIREHTGYVPIEPPEGTGSFGDVTEPTTHLAEPKDYHAELDGSPNWWDVFSPMAQIGNAIETVSNVAVWLGWLEHPYDPQAELVKPFVGDWAGVRAAADILRNVGHAAHSTATNIQWASQSTESVWQGNAGNGAAVYLMNMATPLNDVWGPVDKLAGTYVKASADMTELRDAAVNILNQIGDSAIQAAAAAAVGGGAATTGVGLPVTGLAALFAGYKIHRVIDGIRTLCDIIGKLDTAISVVKAAQTDFGNLQSGVTLPSLPSRPIDVPK